MGRWSVAKFSRSESILSWDPATLMLPPAGKRNNSSLRFFFFFLNPWMQCMFSSNWNEIIILFFLKPRRSRAKCFNLAGGGSNALKDVQICWKRRNFKEVALLWVAPVSPALVFNTIIPGCWKGKLLWSLSRGLRWTKQCVLNNIFNERAILFSKESQLCSRSDRTERGHHTDETFQF